MKQILSLHYALILANEDAFQIEHPSTIFTDDNVPVYIGETVDAIDKQLAEGAAVTLPALPTLGKLVLKDKLYSYDGKIVKCIQEHYRTIYEPEITPALFSVYRTNSDTLAWITNEKVFVGWKRTYNGKTYECLQAHQTQAGWTPDNTPALWKEIIIVVDIPLWVQPTGAHDAYRLGAKVHFPTINDPIYESLIDYNTYSPTVYPAGWKKL